MSNSQWKVPTIDIISFLKEHHHPALQILDSKEEKGSAKKRDVYSILDDEFVGYRNRAVMTELHIATNLPPKSLIAFRPERKAWHEAIVAVSTRVRLADETEMQGRAMQLYERAFPAIEKQSQTLKRRRDYFSKEIEKVLNHEDHSLSPEQEAEIVRFHSDLEKYLQVSQKVLGKYVPGYTAQQAVIDRFTDKYYSQEASVAMEKLINKELENAFRGKVPGFAPIQVPPSHKRCLFMVAGGPASGKGSSVAVLMGKAQEKKVDWLDVVKTNGDSYKPLLLESGTTTPEIYSQLAQEEAGEVKQAVQTRLEKMAKNFVTPHVFVDQTSVGKDRLDMTLDLSGQAYVMLVSTEVGDAVERSFARGKAQGDKGRFENTEMVLNVHRQTTIDSAKRLQECVGKNVLFQIIDNNVKKGQQAVPVLTIDFLSGNILVHDKRKLERFLQKTAINIKATSMADLYTGKPMTVDEYLGPLVAKNMTLQIEESKDDKKEEVQNSTLPRVDPL